MKKFITYKPLSNKEYNMVYGINPLTDLMLETGARIAEIKRLIDEWKAGNDYLDIKTKKSGDSTNRIYLNKKAQINLALLEKYKDMSVKTLQREVKRISTQVGIEFTAHNLRATFATRMLMMGVDLVTVQHLLNHSDISVTALYIRFDENRLRSALNLIDDFETIEGMTHQEAINEIYRLRTKLTRLESMMKEGKNE